MTLEAWILTGPLVSSLLLAEAAVHSSAPMLDQAQREKVFNLRRYILAQHGKQPLQMRNTFCLHQNNQDLSKIYLSYFVFKSKSLNKPTPDKACPIFFTTT